MSPIDPLSILFPKLLLDPSSRKENFPRFQLGEILSGAVIEQLDDQHALVQLKGQEVLVESQLKFSPKAQLRLQVEEVEPKVILRLLPQESSPTRSLDALLKKYLSSDWPVENLGNKLSGLGGPLLGSLPADLQESIKAFISLFKNLSLGDSFFQNPALPREIILQSGLFWESKLRELARSPLKGSPEGIIKGDLKGLLLRLQSKFEAFTDEGPHPEDRAAVKELIDGLGQLAQKIEFYQILNTVSSEPQEDFFFLIPLWFQNNPQFVEVGISLPDKDTPDSEKGSLSILFLLDLPSWEKMKIEVKLKEKNLYGQFTMTDPEAAAFVEQALPALTSRLQKMGYQPFLQLFTEPPEKIEQTLFRERMKGSDSLFNAIV